MADPATMVMASMGANILGGVTKAVGSILGGESKSSMYKYQAGMARANAEIARRNAEYSRTVGEREAQRVGMKSRFEAGNIISAQSGRGLVVGEGSAGRVVQSQGDIGRHDQSTVRANAMRRAYGYDVEAANKEAEANMYGKSAQRSKLASYIEAGGSILGSAASVSSKWMEASQLGVFGGGSGGDIRYGPSPDFPYASYEGA